MMRRFLTICTILYLLFALGCKKEQESPIVYVEKEMLPYCWFPDGSYWIYEEESSPGMVDSIYSTQRAIDTIPDIYGEGFQAESYTWELKGVINTFGEVIIAWGVPPQFQQSFSELNEVFLVNGAQYRDEIFFWDSRGLDTLRSYPTTFVRQQYDSLTVGGITYYDAIEVVTDPPQSAQHTYQVIWARGVGIVKRSMVDGTVWNLVRYRIN